MARKTLPRRTDKEREIASREVVQSYLCTTALYDFNVYEKRVLYILVKLAQSQIEGVRLGDNLHRIDHAYQDFLRVELPISDFLIGPDDKNHQRVKEALISLHRKTFTYQDCDVWKCFSIIANPRIALRSSKVSFIVDSQVWDVILDFSKGFSRYDLEVAFRLESPYSMRLYEMLAGQYTPITYTLEALRKEFCLEGKYASTKDFVRRVIDSARKELDSRSPVTFTYQTMKEGRRINRIMFFPEHRRTPQSEAAWFKSAVRKYGEPGVLDDVENTLLREIGFSQKGIENNLALLLDCRKRMDLPYELTLIKGRAREKENPVGWCINTLKGKLRDLSESKK